MKIPDIARKSGKVFMTCTIDKTFVWENVSPQHILAYIFSGELTLTYGKATLTFVPGDTVLVPKHQLSRSVKAPVDGNPFKCLSMILPEELLREFYQDRPILETWTDKIWEQRAIRPHSLWNGFFTSLLPYFEMQDELPNALISVKTQEALTILDAVDKRASSILSRLEEPGKIDLEKYMEEHFMYNLPLERFAFLTGRSLTTFKSDFKKTFSSTPGKWLMEKRLNLAFYKLKTEKLKVTDVYHSVGFENLSHFSFAFKKAFGYSPSTAASNQHPSG